MVMWEKVRVADDYRCIVFAAISKDLSLFTLDKSPENDKTTANICRHSLIFPPMQQKSHERTKVKVLRLLDVFFSLAFFHLFMEVIRDGL